MTQPTDQSSREQERQLVRVVNKTDYLAIEDTRTGEELRCFSLRELAIAALFAEGYNEAMAIADQRTRAMRETLEKLIRAYVNLMENGRNRIMDLGGDCDPVDAMERRDSHLREARAFLSTLPPTAITAEEAGREGEAKDAALANNCGDFAKLTEEVARDAMRYRCIRNVKGPFEVSMHGAMFWNEGLDAVADAAMLPPAPAQSGGSHGD